MECTSREKSEGYSTITLTRLVTTPILVRTATYESNRIITRLPRPVDRVISQREGPPTACAVSVKPPLSPWLSFYIVLGCRPHPVVVSTSFWYLRQWKSGGQVVGSDGSRMPLWPKRLVASMGPLKRFSFYKVAHSSPRGETTITYAFPGVQVVSAIIICKY